MLGARQKLGHLTRKTWPGGQDDSFGARQIGGAHCMGAL
jgi:hypothetical protein